MNIEHELLLSVGVVKVNREEQEKDHSKNGDVF